VRNSAALPENVYIQVDGGVIQSTF